MIVDIILTVPLVLVVFVCIMAGSVPGPTITFNDKPVNRFIEYLFLVTAILYCTALVFKIWT